MGINKSSSFGAQIRVAKAPQGTLGRPKNPMYIGTMFFSPSNFGLLPTELTNGTLRTGWFMVDVTTWLDGLYEPSAS